MFGLTRQERQVILFLISVALAGVGADFLVKRYAPVKTFFCFNPTLGKVNLNQADKPALMEIPGIGERLAQRIIEYRKEQGDFKEIEELKKIRGITGYRYEKTKDSFCIK